MPFARKPARYTLVALLVAVLLIGLIVVWRQSDATSPKSVFFEALRTNLTQPGITCGVSETATSGTTTQAINLDLASRAKARSVTTLKQANSSVTTEELYTKTDSYIRYTALSSSLAGPDGSKLDFSKALNVWSKSPLTSQTPGLFGSTALGGCVVPLANLTSSKAEQVMTSLREGKVFTTDFSKTKPANLQNTPVIVYDVTVSAQPYVTLMKQVATAYGLKDLDKVDLSTYATKPAEHLKFYVSSSPARILKIDNSARQRVVTFSDYGKAPTITPPKTTITSAELAQRLEVR